ncbi:MAG: hypothetical protein ACFFCM_14480 [Promethearchaeota archaeon]
MLAINTNNPKLIPKIGKLSNQIKDDICRAETLIYYSSLLHKQSNFDEIEKILESLISLIQSTSGEFSRASLFKVVIQIIKNLENESIQTQFLNKVQDLIKNLQDIFSSLLIKLELVKIYNELKRFEAGKELFKEIILNANLISNQDLFLKINKQLIALIPDLQEMIDENIISFFISKLNKLDDNSQKTQILSYLATYLDDLKLPNKLMDIENIMAKTSKPYVLNNIFHTSQYFLYLQFVIKQAFRFNTIKIIQNPLEIVEKAYSEVEKCILLIEIIKQFKARNEKEKSNYYQNLFMEHFDEISNEFERKDVLIELLNSII